MISSDKVTVYDDLQNGLKEQHTDQVGTQLYMSPEQVNNLKEIEEYLIIF